jgi:hypothetical protein
LVHADYAVLVHEIDHVITEKHGGATEADNLDYACAQYSRFKGSDIATFDPQTGQIVPLFNLACKVGRITFVMMAPSSLPFSP